MKVFVLTAILILGACTGQPDQADQHAEAAETSPVVVTRWTDKTELFVEYPPLVAGETSRFAIHLTDLATFEPLREGRGTVELDYGAGDIEVFTEEAPSRPGIFGVNVTPSRAGRPAMTIRVESAAVADKHVLGPAEVAQAGVSGHSHDNHGDHPHEQDGDGHDGDSHDDGHDDDGHDDDGHGDHGHGHDEPATGEAAASPVDEIAFLKEQQWALDFATEIAELSSLRNSLTVHGKVEPRSGGRVTVAATLGGRLALSTKLPVVGTRVARGQVVAAITPPTSTPSDLATLEMASEEAKVKVQFTRQTRERLEKLLEAGAIPARRVAQANADEAVAAAHLKGAQARLEQFEETRSAKHHDREAASFQIRSPLAGIVSAVYVTNGAHVEDAAELLEVVAVDRVYVAAEVPESEMAKVRRPAGAEIIVPGLERPIRAGRLVSVGSIVDPVSRTLKIIHELDNRGPKLAIGQAVSVRLLSRQSQESPVIPVAALVDDDGRPVIYLQRGGESFERRPVTLGNRQDNRVQITAGLSAGERVVTRGAFLIRLASKSTEGAAHGHAH